MSILEKTQSQPTVEQAAQRIKNRVAQQAEQIFVNWLSSFDNLWQSGIFTPEEKIAALGTDAAEVFGLNEALVQFMVASMTGRRDDLVAQINAKVAAMPAYTINQDGTVTLD